MLKQLELLADQQDLSQGSTLDVGTGSGILAIYVAKRGGRDITAIDIDPLSVAAARENARKNQVEPHLNILDTPIHELCQTRHDLVLANILAPVILDLFPEMLLRIKPGGRLMASGIIEKALPDIQQAFESHGFTEVETVQEGPWFLVQAVAPFHERR
jgi:ribosomal protein L11 methyltransferase